MSEDRVNDLTVDRKEVLRYLGYRKGTAPDETVLTRLAACEEKMVAAVDPRSVSKEYPLLLTGEKTIQIERLTVESASLTTNLAGCDRVVLFAATLGIGPDRLIAKAQLSRMSDAVLYQAIAAALIESYCDRVNGAIRREAERAGRSTRPRFSPGYGDLPLSFQVNITRTLDTAKTIGLTLTDSLLMMPTKSVTALIGIRPPAAE